MSDNTKLDQFEVGAERMFAALHSYSAEEVKPGEVLGMTNKAQGRGYISLGGIAKRLNVLVITCDRCGRAN